MKAKELSAEYHSERIILPGRLAIQVNRLATRRGLTISEFILDLLQASVKHSFRSESVASLIGQPSLRLLTGE